MNETERGIQRHRNVESSPLSLSEVAGQVGADRPRTTAGAGP